MRKRPAAVPYHHGDLPQALVASAVKIVSEEGAAALTMRAVAHATGVSHPAIYHHFRGTGELQVAVAVVSLRRLAASMRRRMQRAGSDGVSQLQQAGIAYVLFARKHPELFRLMFGETTSSSRSPELAKAGSETFGVLREAVDACLAQGRRADAASARDVALGAWSVVHGLAHLVVARQLQPPADSAAAVERHAVAVTGLFVAGIVERFDIVRNATERQRRS